MVRKSLEAPANERMEIIERQVSIPRKDFEYLDVALGDAGYSRPTAAVGYRLAVPAGVTCRFELRGIHASQLRDSYRASKRSPRLAMEHRNARW